MGISVISTASAAATATSAATTSATASEGIPGGFADLLFGELQNLLPTPSADIRLATAETLDSQATTGLVDPAVIAAMIGHAQEPRVKNTSTADGIGQIDDKASKGIAGALPIAEKPSQAATDNKGLAETGAEFEKPGLASSNIALRLNRQQAGEAANIAAEAALPETPATALPSQAAGLAFGRATQETTATQPPGIAAHLHESAWPKQFGEKVVWMARAEQQSAQININPPQLGPVQITLNLNGDQASLAFASPHAEVRQAIESALPQLKEMLASAGINLGQSNVGANLGKQNPEMPFQDANGNRSASENAILPANDKGANIAGSAVLHRGRGMVDLFA
jgi:flagellar hook-length control protein FliK